MKMKYGTVCFNCKKPYSKAHVDSVNKSHSQGILRAYEKADRWGRKRKWDYDKIVELRKQGLSWSKIKEQTGASRGSIRYALKQGGLL